jgi:2-keto-3-deoxy-L-rhamnonate aldolase RhmA
MNNPFADLLARRDLPAGYPVGTFVMSASPMVAEAMGCAGFDWAVLDMEHTPLDLMDLVHMLQAVAQPHAAGGARALERHRDGQARARCRRADAAVPFVQNADEARRAVAATQATRPRACAAWRR